MSTSGVDEVITTNSPSPVGSSDDNGDGEPTPTLSPQEVEETPGPTGVPSWAGVNSFYLALRGVWTDASYSLYLEEGGVCVFVCDTLWCSVVDDHGCVLCMCFG